MWCQAPAQYTAILELVSTISIFHWDIQGQVPLADRRDSQRAHSRNKRVDGVKTLACERSPLGLDETRNKILP